MYLLAFFLSSLSIITDFTMLVNEIYVYVFLISLARLLSMLILKL